MDTTFTGETSLTLGKGGRRGAKGVSGWWAPGGCREPAGGRAGIQLTLAPAGPGAPTSPGTPCAGGRVQSQGGEGVALGTPRMHPEVGREGVP